MFMYKQVEQPKEILKKAREAKGYTQESMADALNISGRMYQRYEEGKFPKYKTDKIKNLDKLLGTNLYELIYDTTFPPLSKSADDEEAHISAKGQSDLNMMQEFINSQNALLAEKEARRQEAEARLKKEEDRYDKLFIILETNLKELYERTLDILSAQHVGAAYQMFWIDRWAEKEAAGDNKKTEQLVKAYRKEVADKLRGKKEKSIP